MDTAGAAIGIAMNGANVSSAETAIMIDGAITIMMGGVSENGMETGNSMATTDTGIDPEFCKGRFATAGEQSCQPFFFSGVEF